MAVVSAFLSATTASVSRVRRAKNGGDWKDSALHQWFEAAVADLIKRVTNMEEK
jgi:hypothetical protein